MNGLKQQDGEGTITEQIPLVPPPAYDPDWLNEYHVIGKAGAKSVGKTPANTPTSGCQGDVPTITITSTSVDDVRDKEGYHTSGARPRVNETKMDNKGAHMRDDDEYAYVHRSESPIAIQRGDEYRIPMVADHHSHGYHNHSSHNHDQSVVPSVHYRPCPTREPIMPQDSQDSEPDSHHGFSAHDIYFLGDTIIASPSSLASIPDPVPLSIEPLPPERDLILAHKQPKEIAQYEVSTQTVAMTHALTLCTVFNCQSHY